MKNRYRKIDTGFTLVEIMIVVAIIALLAAIAVPNFLRARKRSQASRIINDLRMIDAAMDQYAIDTGKPTGFSPAFPDIQNYLKTDTVLYSTGTDILGDSYGPFTVDSITQVPTSAFNAYSDVADAGFWGQFYYQGTASAGSGGGSAPMTPDQIQAAASGDLTAIQHLDDFLGSGGNVNSPQGQALVAPAQQAYQQMQQLASQGQIPASMQQAYGNAINYNYNNSANNSVSILSGGGSQ